jgi:pimeloyl-ACP methyl ester carboxylesterase
MAVPLSTGGRAMPAELAYELTMDFVNAPGFVDTFHHADRFSGGKSIQIPLTVAFGTHDWLLLKPEQRRDELPDHVRWMEPTGWGHVPMWKAPDAVADLILQGTA